MRKFYNERCVGQSQDPVSRVESSVPFRTSALVTRKRNEEGPGGKPGRLYPRHGSWEGGDRILVVLSRLLWAMGKIIGRVSVRKRVEDELKR